MDSEDTPPHNDQNPVDQPADDIQETVVSLRDEHNSETNPEPTDPIEPEVAPEPIEVEVPIQSRPEIMEDPIPQPEPIDQHEHQMPEFMNDSSQQQQIPNPNQISDRTAEMLMSDIGPSTASTEPGPIAPIETQAETPPEPAPAPPQLPAVEDNPIVNPYVPPHIPVQDTKDLPAPQQVEPQSQAQNFQEEKPPTKPVSVKKLAVIIGLALIPLLVGVLALVFLGGGDDEPTQTSEEVISIADSQRKTDAGVLLVAIKNNASDNNGDLLTIAPQAVEVFADEYLPEEFNDPTTEIAYQLTTEDPITGEYQYLKGARCTNDGRIQSTDSINDFAIRTLLENGDFYCVDS